MRSWSIAATSGREEVRRGDPGGLDGPGRQATLAQPRGCEAARVAAEVQKLRRERGMGVWLSRGRVARPKELPDARSQVSDLSCGLVRHHSLAGGSRGHRVLGIIGGMRVVGFMAVLLLGWVCRARLWAEAHDVRVCVRDSDGRAAGPGSLW